MDGEGQTYVTKRIFLALLLTGLLMFLLVQCVGEELEEMEGDEEGGEGMMEDVEEFEDD